MSKLKEKYVIFQSQEWLNDNTYKDDYLCFWETEYDRDNYDEEEKHELNYRIDDNGSQSLDPSLCGTMSKLCYADKLLWAVDKFINTIDDPEYFI